VTDDSEWVYLIQVHTGQQNQADLYIYVHLKKRLDIHKKEMLGLELKGKNVRFKGICLTIPPQYNRIALLCVLKENNTCTRNITNFEKSFFTNIREEWGHCFEDITISNLTGTDLKKERTISHKNEKKDPLLEKHQEKINELVQDCLKELRKDKRDKKKIAKIHQHLHYYTKKFDIPNEIGIKINNCKIKTYDKKQH
jgi:hypothetical protein